MENRQVEFQFKGARSYIQGPDIFNAMVGLAYPASNIGNIRFSVHDFVRTPLCQLYRATSKEQIKDVQDVRARCQFKLNGTTYWLALAPDSGDAQSGNRQEYDEARVVSLMRMQEDGVEIDGQSPFSFIETIVSMNKYMHQQLFPEVAGKWIFTQVDLDFGCEAREKLGLKLRHNMNYRLTKSDVLVGGNKIGDLYFSLVKS